jgi:hypothetical protein
LEALTNQAHELTLYCNQLLNDTFKLTVSDAAELFEGKAFTGWKKSREHETKLKMAVIERLDALNKNISRRR